MMTVQLFEHATNHWIIQFKLVNNTVCELYLNKLKKRPNIKKSNKKWRLRFVYIFSLKYKIKSCIKSNIGYYREWHWNTYNIIYETNCQSRFGTWYWLLGAGALGWPRGMVWGGRRKGGSGWGTRVYLWRIHADVWQNKYNTLK